MDLVPGVNRAVGKARSSAFESFEIAEIPIVYLLRHGPKRTHRLAVDLVQNLRKTRVNGGSTAEEAHPAGKLTNRRIALRIADRKQYEQEG